MAIISGVQVATCVWCNGYLDECTLDDFLHQAISSLPTVSMTYVININVVLDYEDLPLPHPTPPFIPPSLHSSLPSFLPP